MGMTCRLSWRARCGTASLAPGPQLVCVHLTPHFPAAISLLYWSRLAYQEEQQLDNEYVDAKSALALFGLQE